MVFRIIAIKSNHVIKKASSSFLVELDKKFGLDRAASFKPEFQLSIETYMRILAKAYPWRYESPPTDSRPILAMSPEARVRLMRQRVALGLAVSAPSDLPLGAAPLGVAFSVSRRRNGSLRVAVKE